MDVQKFEDVVTNLHTKEIPVFQEINGEQVILDKSLPASKAILLSLYLANGSLKKSLLFQKLSAYYKTANLSTTLSNLNRDRKIHIDKSSLVHLTAHGESMSKQIMLANTNLH